MNSDEAPIEMYEGLFEELQQYFEDNDIPFDPEEIFDEAFDEDLWTETEEA